VEEICNVSCREQRSLRWRLADLSPQLIHDKGMVLPDRLAAVTVPIMRDESDALTCVMKQMRFLLPAEDRVPLILHGGR